MNRKSSPRSYAAIATLAVAATLLAPSASALALPFDLPPARVGPVTVEEDGVDLRALGAHARVAWIEPATEQASSPAEDAEAPAAEADAAAERAPGSMISSIVGWIATHWLLVMLAIMAVAILGSLVGRRAGAKRTA